MLNRKPAKGVKGYLIRTFTSFNGTDKIVFRVYDEETDNGPAGRTFTDYDILHYDLEVEILDDALFYDDGKHQWIDYDDSYLNTVVDEILKEDELKNGN